MPQNTLIDFNNDTDLIKYLSALDKETDPLRHESYHFTVAHAAEMSIHVKGDTPEALLTEYRPHEDQAAYEYRLKIYEPITKAWSAKVINVTDKIRSANSSIVYDEPAGIVKDNPLEDYAEKDYPKFGSITEWVYNVLITQMYADPNSIITIQPRKQPLDESEFLEPVGICYRSDQLLDYDDSNYYTILLDEKSPIDVNGKIEFIGNIYMVFTSTEILKIVQVGKDGKKKTYAPAEAVFTYEFTEPPVFFIGGDYLPNVIPYTHKSFMSGVVPFWNKAIRIDSDLDANYVTHMYQERVELELECTADCRKYEEEGFYGHVKDGECVRCNTCKGTGKMNGRSPFSSTVIKKEEFGENPQVFPGIQYIDKPIEIVELSERKIENLKNQGFSAINMDILNKVGENQSGVAKTIDRSDLNSYIHKVSDNIYDNIIENTYKYVNAFRYGTLLKGDKLTDNLPTINKPTRFDIITIALLIEELKIAKEAGASDETLALLEKEIVDNKFVNDLSKRAFIDNVLKLDPMPNKDEGDKVLILSSRGTTIENYIISSNIKPFIIRAIGADEEFFTKTFEEKMAVLMGFATELIKLTQPQLPIVDESGNNE